jgi:hypothetical protein
MFQMFQKRRPKAEERPKAKTLSRRTPVLPKKKREASQAEDQRRIHHSQKKGKEKPSSIVFKQKAQVFLTGTYNDGSFSAVLSSIDRFAGGWRAGEVPCHMPS